MEYTPENGSLLMEVVLATITLGAATPLPQGSVMFLLVACAALLGVLYRVWQSTPEKRSRDEQDRSNIEASTLAQGQHRNTTVRLPMPRLTLEGREASHYKVEAEETTRRVGTAEGDSLRMHERATLSAGAELAVSAVPAAPEEITLEARDCKEMVFIPAGEFWMGSDDKDDNEKPLHKVWIDAYYIDKYPVTNAEFARFVEATGYVTEAEESGKGWIWQAEWREVAGACWRHPNGPDSSIEHRQDHPVVLVSWNDARNYCRWAGKRLPSEAEWEHAARGSDARKWPWGNEWEPSRLNSGERGLGSTTPVGQHPQGRSPFGLHDVAGNVWEWVDGWYQPYPGSPGKDEDFGEKYRVLRGGSWDSFGHNARCANRTRNLARACVNVNGFRCALSASVDTRPLAERNYDTRIPARRLLAGRTPDHLGQPLLRLRDQALGGQLERPIASLQVIEMGRKDIERLRACEPFLFRNGKKAFNLEELVRECITDPEAGRYHLHNGQLATYLDLLGWRASRQAETIARGYSPQRDLPYFLALVTEYARHFYLGLEMLPPSEEVLDSVVVHRQFTSLMLREGQVLRHAQDDSEMLFIPEGRFIMGSTAAQLEEALQLARIYRPKEADASWFSDEGPQHAARTDAYFADKVPVTNQQFEHFVRQSGYKPEGDWRAAFLPGKEQHPVVLVTYQDALAYARWAGKTLPSEAQWEKATRGTDGRKYPWGNRWDPARLNSFEQGPGTTTPVGLYPEGASPYGLLDTLGNVWEWTGDLYLPYPHASRLGHTQSSSSDASGDDSATRRVFRGGSWNNFQYNNRCANRHREAPSSSSLSKGFRCVRAVQAQDLYNIRTNQG